MANCSLQRAAAEKDNTKLASNINLQSPLQLDQLDTPASASSLTCSPADLTPLLSLINGLGLNTPNSHTRTTATKTTMDSDTTLPLDEPYTTDRPPADIHSKLQVSTAVYSRTAALSSFHGAFEAGKRLQQVFGYQPPEPFARPPPVPPDLEERFMVGLEEYGLDRAIPSEEPDEKTRQAVNMHKKGASGVSLGSKVLDDIKEEMESPTRATHILPGAETSSKSTTPPNLNNGMGSVSDQRSRHNKEDTRAHSNENIDRDQQRTALNHVQPATAPRGEPSIGTENDEYDMYGPLPAFGSTTTLVDSEPSRSNQSGTHVADSTSEPLPKDSKEKIMSASAKLQAAIGTDSIPPLRSSSLANMTDQTGCQDAGEVVKGYFNKCFRARTLSDQIQRGSSAPPILLPPHEIDRKQAWDVEKGQRVASAPTTLADINHLMDGARVPTPLMTPFSGLPTSRSLTTIPSMPISKKRPASSQGLPTARVQLDESTTGLPILDANQELLWKTRFPGNTYALLTVLLTWTFTMQRLHKQIQDPYLFSLNPAFPYPITPPVHQKLISVAFYDNSTIPHKEIRFIGPKDVAEMSYNEVDIFSSPQPSQSNEESKICAMKRAMGLRSSSPSLPSSDGTGRWCYIILKGHIPNSSTEPAPHVMLAWPKSSMTNSSDCLHTVYPDITPAARPPLHKAPKRFSSLQNLAAAMRLDKTLRTASSGSLPAVVKTESREGALMLKRRVVKMEKAGRLPLIEGYRIDVRNWKGWLGAVGRGNGKVIMWMERD